MNKLAKTKMGTPLKTLTSKLSPKVLSPLSPRLIVSKSSEKSIKTRSVSSNVLRISPVKNLELSKFTQNSKLLIEPVNIYITDFDARVKEVKKHDIFINSPMKRNIIKNGIGNERYLNILGKGSFGKVIRAVHEGTTVALKLVKTSKFSSRENNALQLQHQNIVKTLQIIGSEKSAFSIILMEYFPVCRDMQSILDDPEIRLDDEVVVKYAKNICEGLLHCHENDILHLDLKPQNVLLCGDVCKICDFGNSVKISELGDHFEHHGTVHYSAPEILKGNKPSKRSDVYSFGILLWQILSRNCPYSEIDNIETIIYMVVKCHLRPNLKKSTDKFSELYQTCWKNNPHQRPSVGEILGNLSHF